MTNKILLVEDDRTISGLVSEILKLEGLEIECAIDGLEGRIKLEASDYCAVITDLFMPREDGKTLLRWIAENKQDMPVFVMSSYSNKPISYDDIPVQILGTYRKPVDISDIQDLAGKLKPLVSR